MVLHSLLLRLQATDFATAIREGETLFPWIESIHVVAITLVVGSISVVDLRLLGLASRNRAFSKLNAEIVPITWAAFAVAAVSGSLLFSSKAVQYAGNLSFQMKIAMIGLAGLNMLVFQLRTFRQVLHWDCALPPPPAAKLGGFISLCLWIGIIIFGRTIGFTMTAIGG